MIGRMSHAEYLYRRLQARFKPGNAVLCFHDRTQMDIRDISEKGFRLRSVEGLFETGKLYTFDLVFVESDVAGFRVKAECRWVSETHTGFMLMMGQFGRAISARILNQHLRGAMRVKNGAEL